MKPGRLESRVLVGAALVAFGLYAAAPALAPGQAPAADPRLPPDQRAEPLPPELQGVGITERPDQPIPLDLEFTDEDGETVKLSEFFRQGRPVLLTLNYYTCPMLCDLQLNGLVDGLQEMSWVPGKQFEIVTVSFDPRETHQLAKLKKQSYLSEYGRPYAAKGWHFLTGRQENIAALAEAVGFHFRWNEDRREFMHVAAVMVCTPQGRLSRYLYGVMYEARTLRLSLVEAAEGKVGSTLDRIILYCFHYDADARRYAPAAVNIMRAGGALTALLLGGLLIPYWLRGTRKGKAPETESQS